ncbi:MAG: D-Ala-D-Ala carboxypeptidase family metallohydrolase [candidate division KSB1 bacterium]|nr:D-Ala-D-Ala carboxypeptidase family metallohydrolase [candidate division KSB1 bacterium]
MIPSILHPMRLFINSQFLLAFILSCAPTLLAVEKFDTGEVCFSIRFKNEISSYRLMTIFLLPNEKIELQAVVQQSTSRFQLVANDGQLISERSSAWLWQAPAAPGIYPVRIVHFPSQEAMQLQMIVLVPFEKMDDGQLNGCFIGDYPEIPDKYADKYETPAGFVEITEENQHTWITPHFQLKQFLCKQTGGFPKYTVLQERLLLKLELILKTINLKGIRCQTLTIMSGYRTPYYNNAIGNVRFSRHIYGAAADFYIDESPKDGQMDDLNGDNRIDIRDAQLIAEHIEALSQESSYKPFEGGLAVYKSTASHGPFVHVDVRGFRARW